MRPNTLVFPTGKGTLNLTLLGHGSVMLEYDAKVIYVDPYSKATSFAGLPKAGQIWITHEHYDHLDLEAIRQVEKAETRFVANANAASQLKGPVTVLHNGDDVSLDGISIKAVPAYNTERGPAPGRKYHPKDVGNGYVATFGTLRLYIAGDTEPIPEMAELNDIDVALLPVMLPYTMSPDQAVEAALSFQPKLVLPYHASKSDAQATVNRLAGTEIDAQVVMP